MISHTFYQKTFIYTFLGVLTIREDLCLLIKKTFKFQLQSFRKLYKFSKLSINLSNLGHLPVLQLLLILKTTGQPFTNQQHTPLCADQTYPHTSLVHSSLEEPLVVQAYLVYRLPERVWVTVLLTYRRDVAQKRFSC